jgi:hypothetical protein
MNAIGLIRIDLIAEKIAHFLAGKIIDFLKQTV